LGINDGFTKKDSVDQIKDYYIRDSDPLAAFFMDCVETTNDSDDYVTLHEFHAAFVVYCKRWKFKDTSQRKFNSAVRKDFNLKESREYNDDTGKQDRVWSGVFLSLNKDSNDLPTLMTEKTEKPRMTESGTYREQKRYKKEGKGNPVISGFQSQSEVMNDVMKFIQKKISEYGDESDHAYNVIEAMLEKSGVTEEEAEYCITLHKQGHRVYISPKE